MQPSNSNYGIEQALQQIAQALSPIVNPNSLIDGWIPLAQETWTYLSSSTVTVPSGATSRYSIGDKVKFIQSGTIKYFYVVAVTDTVLTLNAGSDFTVANASIEFPAFSKASTPTGFPSFFNWSPTFAGLTVGNGTVLAQFRMDGKKVYCEISFRMGSTSSISSLSTATLPVTADARYTNSNIYGVGTLHIEDNAVQTYPGTLELNGTTTVRFLAQLASSTYVQASGYSNTVPFTWGSLDYFNGTFSYTAA